MSFFEAGTKDQLGDSLLLEHRVLGLEIFCLQVQRDQKATVNQTPAILTAYCSHQLQTNFSLPDTFDLAAGLHREWFKLAALHSWWIKLRQGDQDCSTICLNRKVHWKVDWLKDSRFSFVPPCTPPPSFHCCSPVKPECQVYQGHCSSRDCVCVSVCLGGCSCCHHSQKHHCDILLECHKASQYYLNPIASSLAELSVWPLQAPFAVLRSKPVPLSRALCLIMTEAERFFFCILKLCYVSCEKS